MSTTILAPLPRTGDRQVDENFKKVQRVLSQRDGGLNYTYPTSYPGSKLPQHIDTEGVITWETVAAGGIADGSVVASKLTEDSMGISTDIVFAANDYQTVGWSSADIDFANGTTYTIDAGNTGAMSALTYIYLDVDTSSTVLQVSTTFSDAVGDRKVLMCVAKQAATATEGPFFVPRVGEVLISNGQIAAKSVKAAQIFALTITAAEIAANTITAGQIAANVITTTQLIAGLQSAVSNDQNNMLVNGSFGTGTTGSAATGWTTGAGNTLNIAEDEQHSGQRSGKIDNTGGAANSYHYQTMTLVENAIYEISGWIKTSALTAADAGHGAVIQIDPDAGVTGFTVLEKVTDGADPAASDPDCGIEADDGVHDWTFVRCRFIPTGGSGTVKVYCVLGHGGVQDGECWFDDVKLVRLYSILAGDVSISTLDAISANVGTLTAGLIQNDAGVNYIDLDATGASLFIRAGSNFSVTADGTAIFGGTVTSSLFTADELSVTQSVTGNTHKTAVTIDQTSTVAAGNIGLWGMRITESIVTSGNTPLWVSSLGVNVTANPATVWSGITGNGTIAAYAGITVDGAGIGADAPTITTEYGIYIGNIDMGSTSYAIYTNAGLVSLGAAVTVRAGGIAVTGNSTIAGTLGSLTGLTMASGTLAAQALTATTGVFSGAVKITAQTLEIENASAPVIYLDHVGQTTWQIRNGGAGNGVWDLWDGAASVLAIDASGDSAVFAGSVDMQALTATTGVFTDDVKVSATKLLYLDGGTHTYITEDSTDHMQFVVGGVAQLGISTTAATFANNVGCDHILPNTANTYNLGGPSNQWNNLYMKSGGLIYASTTEIVDINTGGIRFHNAYQFPTTDGANLQVLVSDGSENVDWDDQAGGADYVLQAAYGMKLEDVREGWQGLVDIDEYRRQTEATGWLPGIGPEVDWLRRPRVLHENVEQLALYTFDHEDRIRELEAELARLKGE